VLALGQQLRYALNGGIGSGLRELAMDAILRIVQKTPFWVLALLATLFCIRPQSGDRSSAVRTRKLETSAFSRAGDRRYAGR
jgi:hypothetical protein